MWRAHHAIANLRLSREQLEFERAEWAALSDSDAVAELDAIKKMNRAVREQLIRILQRYVETPNDATREFAVNALARFGLRF